MGIEFEHLKKVIERLFGKSDVMEKFKTIFYELIKDSLTSNKTSILSCKQIF